jgi:hypothetical protein
MPPGRSDREPDENGRTKKNECTPACPPKYLPVFQPHHRHPFRGKTCDSGSDDHQKRHHKHQIIKDQKPGCGPYLRSGEHGKDGEIDTPGAGQFDKGDDNAHKERGDDTPA